MVRSLERPSDTILMIATSEGRLADTDIPTGAWAETIAEPYYTFLRKGYNVDMASIAGGGVPIEPLSIEPPRLKTHTVKLMLTDPQLQRLLKRSLPVSLLDPQDYAAIFITGGHGIAWDGPFSKELKRLLEEAYAMGKTIAAVDHGPAALINAMNLKLGAPLERILFRKQVTAISDIEEEALGRAALVPFLVEDKLREVDAIYTRSLRDFDPFVVRSGQLITGQNWQSSKAAADTLVDALSFGVRLTP